MGVVTSDMLPAEEPERKGAPLPLRAARGALPGTARLAFSLIAALAVVMTPAPWGAWGVVVVFIVGWQAGVMDGRASLAASLVRGDVRRA